MIVVPGVACPLLSLDPLPEEPLEAAARFSRATVSNLSGGSGASFSGAVAVLDRESDSNQSVIRTASGIPDRFG